jgi:hypothetical protein
MSDQFWLIESEQTLIGLIIKVQVVMAYWAKRYGTDVVEEILLDEQKLKRRIHQIDFAVILTHLEELDSINDLIHEVSIGRFPRELVKRAIFIAVFRAPMKFSARQLFILANNPNFQPNGDQDIRDFLGE